MASEGKFEITVADFEFLVGYFHGNHKDRLKDWRACSDAECLFACGVLAQGAVNGKCKKCGNENRACGVCG